MLRIIIPILLLTSILFSEPPRKIPENLIKEFTINGKIPVFDYYLDGTYSEPLFYSKTTITEKIKAVLRGELGYYGLTDKWIYDAFAKYPIKGKDVVIIGSTTPWYESMVIAYGGRPTTIEYNKITTDDPRLTILTPDQWKKKKKKFDMILCISSVEHDGLGRYGDPINPNGDLEFMEMARKKLLKKSGKMILAVPIGPDAICFNAHRIYGRIRFPMLTKDWSLEDSFGFNISEFDSNAGYAGYQPVFYLSPKSK